MRRQARIDANQPEIVAVLKGVGASVLHLHQLGKGVPDLLVGFRGREYLLELKDGSKPPSKRKLTPDEERWHADWRGSVHVVNDVNEALQVIGAIR